jgi:hypothetical protein
VSWWFLDRMWLSEKKIVWILHVKCTCSDYDWQTT